MSRPALQVVATEVGPFPPGIKPVRKGVYRTRLMRVDNNPVRNGYSYWNGYYWADTGVTPQHARDRRRTKGLQDKFWWGLEGPA